MPSRLILCITKSFARIPPVGVKMASSLLIVIPRQHIGLEHKFLYDILLYIKIMHCFSYKFIVGLEVCFRQPLVIEGHRSFTRLRVGDPLIIIVI